MHGRDEKYLKGRYHVGDTGTGGRIILRCIFKK
jgi:hypothetical protein